MVTHDPQTPFERRSKTAFDESVDNLSGEIRSRLTQARHRALEEAAAPRVTRRLWLPAAGLNDWGGISPLTPDHINPERPWPGLAELRRRTELAGHELRERLAVYPEYATRAGFLDERLRDRPETSALDEYGATDAAEFFAVATEAYFERPEDLREFHPELYEELRRFYRVELE